MEVNKSEKEREEMKRGTMKEKNKMKMGRLRREEKL